MERTLEIKQTLEGTYSVLTGLGFLREGQVIGLIRKVGKVGKERWQLSYNTLTYDSVGQARVFVYFPKRADCIAHMEQIKSSPNILTMTGEKRVNAPTPSSKGKRPTWNYVKKERTNAEREYKRAWNAFRNLQNTEKNTAKYHHLEIEFYSKCDCHAIWGVIAAFNARKEAIEGSQEIYELTQEAKAILQGRDSLNENLKDLEF